ncbi:hypothetical protein SFyv_1443 [Shigella flexneri Shi06HN006]|nr:hypothetical protein SFy_1398 [Shigella flexneri 2003036]AIL39949.1 hypothetical protein SFyv_1443 [Shigella flexneri Shi06HN006]EFJ95425.1 hypothetical protein HMPREF9540_04569 [Escherichia coli MS 115-1]EFS15123.1 hypothetical protein SF2457T_0724 [Shigella flexneri 2a str. 2457T]EGJ90150.1 hypothetical protein SF274771_1316 [Shigella flexneri 2747-71]EGJ93074.1 hypothetical protein SFK671_1207 [Shigella flexneri K-671]EGM62620.1 hypothetical protein SFJ1713_1132 [Shigella flexneri SFJ17
MFAGFGANALPDLQVINNLCTKLMPDKPAHRAYLRRSNLQ